jgi:hypothetical protein
MMHLTRFRNPSSDLLSKKEERKKGKPTLKNIPGFKAYHLFLVLLLSFLITLLAACGEDTGTSSTAMTSPSHVVVITPIGAQPVCLTVDMPSLSKLADGNYSLKEEIDNCGGKDANPLKVTLQIGTQTLNLLGPASLPAKGKAMYNSQKLHFTGHPSSSATVTILATINSSVQGEWDGQITIPN